MSLRCVTFTGERKSGAELESWNCQMELDTPQCHTTNTSQTLGCVFYHKCLIRLKTHRLICEVKVRFPTWTLTNSVRHSSPALPELSKETELLAHNSWARRESLTETLWWRWLSACWARLDSHFLTNLTCVAFCYLAGKPCSGRILFTECQGGILSPLLLYRIQKSRWQWFSGSLFS